MVSPKVTLLFKIILFIYLFLTLLGLPCCAGFSSCSERELVSSCGARALGVRASVTETHESSSCSSWALEIVVMDGLICSEAHGIFLNQGSNPCLLH